MWKQEECFPHFVTYFLMFSVTRCVIDNIAKAKIGVNMPL